ncbi:putative PAS/PAC sensor protein [Pedosphaera parvula Ellin514]|uniref:histidine kinase n=2 Tax=Pedosphaera TaxID=1032526 RepID=B9XCR3_PEDPL|nr:putative PAS/PAC sensor protein [Pedosphaera parvula Ellin514]
MVWVLLKNNPPITICKQMNSEAKLFGLPLRTFSKIAAGMVAFLGTFVLIGWAADFKFLLQIIPGMPAMNPLTAVCFILAAISLICSQQTPGTAPDPLLVYIGRTCAAFIGLAALLKLASSLTGWGFQVDQLLFRHELAAQSVHFPRAMSPNTAINLFCCAAGLVTLDKRTKRGQWPAQYLAIWTMLWAWLTLVSYLFDSRSFYSTTSYVPMALHTCAAFVVLTLGMLTARPEHGIIATLCSMEVGGKITRRLMPLAIFIPSLLGGLKMINHGTSLFAADFSVSMVVIASIVISMAIICGIGAALNDSARERRRVQRGLRDSQRRFRSIWEHSADGMRLTDGEGTMIDVNPAFCDMVGIRAEELLNKPISELFADDEDPRRSLQKYKERFRAGMIDQNLEKQIKFRSGRVADVEVSVSYVELEGGKPLLLSIFRDISERKIAETQIRELNEVLERRVAERTAELEASEQRYLFLADSMPHIIWTAKPDGSLDYFNQRWVEHTGLNLEEAKDWGWQAAIHPEDLESCMARWSQACETGESFETEYRLRQGSDEVYRWHLGRALPLRDEKGDIVQWVGTCTDINDLKQVQDEFKRLNADLEKRVEDRTNALTKANLALEKDLDKRKLVEASLARVKAKLEAILDAATQVAIIATDTNGIITMFNPGAERILGYTKEEMVGKVTPERYHVPNEVESYGAQLSEEFDRTIAGFSVLVEQARHVGYEEREWTYVRKDGLLIPVSVVVTALREADGKMVGFLAIVRDVSRRKEAEAELRASEARFRALSASSPIGIFQTDLAGNCLYANAQWLRLAGLRSDEVTGLGWTNAIYPPERDEVMKEMAACSKEGREFTREFRVQTPEGIVRWVRSRAATIMAQGKAVGYVGTTEDITERRAAEEQLRRFAADVENTNSELKEALAKVKTLRGLLPICSGCKKIRDDKGYWNQIEFFIRDHSDANFSHGMCPECAKQFFPGFVAVSGRTQGR